MKAGLKTLHTVNTTFGSFIGFIAALLCLLFPVAAFSEDSGPGVDTESTIHITADSLTSRQADRFAEFSGNVRVTQDQTVITADTLRIHFNSGESGPDNEGEEDSIEKLVASGNVVIDHEDLKGFCEMAVYTSSDGLLVLTGEKVLITNEGSAITGQKVVFNRDTGEITITSETESRVEALFNQGASGILGNQPGNRQ